MKVTIKLVENGYIVVFPNEGVEGLRSYQVFPDTLGGFKELLYLVNELVGPETNRYSEKRIRITTEPGDKYEPVPE